MKAAFFVIFFPILYPFAKLYELIGMIRNFAYNKGYFESKSFEIPIISVGNITVGGTGKTPHSEFLLRLLNKNYKTALLSRGYKRKTTGFVEAKPGSTVADIGDEPKQISLKFSETIVAVDANRCRGAETLMKNYSSLEVIVLDDAFQHRKIKPGFSIVLLDYNRLPHRDFLMPLGSLRENTAGLKRADAIIVSKSPEQLTTQEQEKIKQRYLKISTQYIYFTTIKYTNLQPIIVANSEILLNKLSEYNVLLVTGIANAYSIKNFLNKTCLSFKHLAYPDHYNYQLEDLQRIEKEYELLGEKKIVITTEKDSYKFKEIVKYTNFAGSFVNSFYCLLIEVQFLNNASNLFENQIITYVEKNKRNR